MNKSTHQSFPLFLLLAFLLFSFSIATFPPHPPSHKSPPSSPHKSSPSHPSGEKPFAGIFDKLFAFGDSDSDTGNAALLHGTSVNKHSGNIIDSLSSSLGLASIPPFMKHGAGAESKGGVSFGVGGSTALSADFYLKKNISMHGSSGKGAPLSFKTQLAWFREYLAKAGLRFGKDADGGVEFDKKFKFGKIARGDVDAGVSAKGGVNPTVGAKGGVDLESDIGSKGGAGGGKGGAGGGKGGGGGKGSVGGGKGGGRVSVSGGISSSLFWIGEMGVSDYTSESGTSLNSDKLAQMSSKYTIELLKEIKASGGRYMIVQGLPPIGCFPLYLTLTTKQLNLDPSGCMMTINAAVLAHNKMLQLSLEFFRKDNPDCIVLYADYWAAYLEVMKHPKKYGIVEPSKACCGTGGKHNFNKMKICGAPGTSVCKDPSKYISWDGIHPTEAMQRIMTRKFLHEGFCHPSFDKFLKLKKAKH